MNPFYATNTNSGLPYHSNQNQTNVTPPPLPQQGMPNNSFQGQVQQGMPNNPFQGQVQQQTGVINPQMGMPNNPFQGQVQQQMGVMNPQMVMPLNNPNPQMCSGNLVIPNRPFMNMNVPNQFFPMQNAMMRPFGQFNAGFVSGPQNANPIAMNQPSGQFFIPYNNQNATLPNGQFNATLPNGQFNATLPNGQFCLQGPHQNMVQFVQMQMPNFAQLIPANLPKVPNNQVAHSMMPPQNHNFPGNQQFCPPPHGNAIMQQGNQEQQKLISPVTDVAATNNSPNSGQLLQGNSSVQLNLGSVQPQQAQNFCPPTFTNPQGNLGNINGVSNVNPKWERSPGKNFTRMKTQFQHKQNAQGKTRFHDQHGHKGFNNDGAAKFADATNRTGVERKPLPLTYTEEEIQQWREARKKNYPSNSSVDKVAKNQTLPEVTDGDAKLRRQQLKEILAKQAELGCEVAEIPSSYLSDSEQGHGKEWRKRGRGKNGRFQNKLNKRGKLHQNEKFKKKQMSGDQDCRNTNNEEKNGSMQKQHRPSSDHTSRSDMKKREPTLLQKLLAPEISRDKSHLLQAFRFIVVNSFFKDWPEKPLRFPQINVKESGSPLISIEEIGAMGELVKGESSLAENTCSEDSQTFTKVNYRVSINDDAYNEGNDEANVQSRGNFSQTVVEHEEEEGEIID